MLQPLLVQIYFIARPTAPCDVSLKINSIDMNDFEFISTTSCYHLFFFKLLVIAVIVNNICSVLHYLLTTIFKEVGSFPFAPQLSYRTFSRWYLNPFDLQTDILSLPVVTLMQGKAFLRQLWFIIIDGHILTYFV